MIKYMVDRFLTWKLPADFNPDGGISFEQLAGKDGPHPFKREPTGTNLFTATQAEAMVRYMVEGAPPEDAWQHAINWAVERWKAEVANRPLVNIYRRTLDTQWRQVIRHFGGDPDELCGPSHDELLDKA